MQEKVERQTFGYYFNEDWKKNPKRNVYKSIENALKTGATKA